MASQPNNRRSEARKQFYQANPEAHEAARKNLIKARAARCPEQMRRRWSTEKPWIKGNAAQPAGSPSRMVAGARSSATKLAWCPTHLREEYLFLTGKKRLKAAEARAMIEDLHKVEMQRWRREHGLVVEAEERAKPGRKPAMGNDKEFLDAVLPYVADITGISVETINGPAKAGSILRARFVAILAIRRRFGTGISFDAIGAMIGGRDHSTIQHAYKRALQFEKDDPEFAALVAEVLAA